MSLSVDTLRSLKGNGRSIVVLGDMMELGDHADKAHRELGVLVARAGIARLYATGQFAGVLAEGAIGAGMEAEKTFVGSREEIVETLMGSLGPGDWVLVKGSRLMVMEKVVEDLQSEIAKRES
jgi:UDP-N-acetylmuramoyl-tripeptide--D-alanyl-D-alanine ligase